MKARYIGSVKEMLMKGRRESLIKCRRDVDGTVVFDGGKKKGRKGESELRIYVV